MKQTYGTELLFTWLVLANSWSKLMWFSSSTVTRKTFSLNGEIAEEEEKNLNWVLHSYFLVSKEEGLAHLRSCLLTLRSSHQNGEQMLGPQRREPRVPTLCLARSFGCISPAFIVQGVLCFLFLIANRHYRILINGFPGIVALVPV